MFSLFFPVTATQSSVPASGTIECAAIISALRVIAVDSDGKAIYADNLSGNPVIGLSLAGGGIGDRIPYLTEGFHTDLGWSWATNQPLFLIADGQMSHVAPTSNYIVQVGYAKSATTIVFTPDYEVYLIEG